MWGMNLEVVPIQKGHEVRRRDRLRFAAITAGAALISFGLTYAALLYEQPLRAIVADILERWWPPPAAEKPVVSVIEPVHVATPKVEVTSLGRRTFARCAGKKRTTCVVDGDTLWLDGIKIRLADIDAPEIDSPRCRAELERGEWAADRLVVLLNRGPLKMTRVDRDVDVYGRALRVVSVGGQSAGDMLIAEGLARRWDGARRPWC